MHIIPAIDIIEGKCVRLTQGDYSQKKIYNTNPLEVALEFQDAGLSRLHLVDLDGAKARKIVNLNVLETLASKTTLHIDFGGGVQSDQDIENAFNAGAKQITGGSIAVKNSGLFKSWIEKYGSKKIILGADVKNEKIAISGWAEESDIDINTFLNSYIEQKVKYVICTDIGKDGLLQGPSFNLYSRIFKDFPGLKLIASGGVSNIEDIKLLAKAGIYGAIVGKAIYEGKIKIKELVKIL
jgi:phosphoribosylformimino-5-aminoimidazole carboxamide ribotide isomerase